MFERKPLQGIEDTAAAFIFLVCLFLPAAQKQLIIDSTVMEGTCHYCDLFFFLLHHSNSAANAVIYTEVEIHNTCFKWPNSDFFFLSEVVETGSATFKDVEAEKSRSNSGLFYTKIGYESDICQCDCRLRRQFGYSPTLWVVDENAERCCRLSGFLIRRCFFLLHLKIRGVSFGSALLKSYRNCDEHTHPVSHKLNFFCNITISYLTLSLVSIVAWIIFWAHLKWNFTI